MKRQTKKISSVLCVVSEQAAQVRVVSALVPHAGRAARARGGARGAPGPGPGPRGHVGGGLVRPHETSAGYRPSGGARGSGGPSRTTLNLLRPLPSLPTFC